MTGTAIDTKAAVEVAKSAAGILPQEGKTVVLDHLVSGMTPETLKALSPEAREKLLQALTGTEAAPSATTSQAVSEIKTIDNHKAVLGQLIVNGQQVDTLLSEGSFNKSRPDQREYAAELGYRMATREEHRAYVEGLLAKKDNNTINDAERKALQTYRDRYVRDTAGGLVVNGWGVHDRDILRIDNDILRIDNASPDRGALFVRASKALSPEAREKLLQAPTGNEAAPSATTSQAVSEIKTIDNHKAVVGQITVNGRQLDTLLSEGSYNKPRPDQREYAAKLGYRMATHEENWAYYEGLLAKEDNKTINDAEKNALQAYRERYVRDTAGGLDVGGRRSIGDDDRDWYGFGYPKGGALFVRASAESK